MKDVLTTGEKMRKNIVKVDLIEIKSNHDLMN